MLDVMAGERLQRMGAKREAVFTTEQVTALLGLKAADKWRVTKFVQSREYGISPSITDAAGPGSRRLYDLENVCEIGLALRLLEAGLRPKVIGHVLKELRQDGKLSRKLKIEKDRVPIRYLGICLFPKIGKPLDVSRVIYVDFFDGFMEAEPILGQLTEPDALGPNVDVLFVAVGLVFHRINERLEIMEAERGKP